MKRVLYLAIQIHHFSFPENARHFHNSLFPFTVKTILPKMCTLIFIDQIYSIMFLHLMEVGSFHVKEFIELFWSTSFENKMVRFRYICLSSHRSGISEKVSTLSSLEL
jgi:hypothetical protein